MKKKIIRLTENDLHHIIENVVNKMLKEDATLNNFDYIDDILNAVKISKCSIEFINSTYGEGEIEIIGKSGINYQANCSVIGEYKKGMESHDYDVPDDDDETYEKLTDVELFYYDENIGKWVELSQDIEENDQIKKFLLSHINFDWSDYDAENDYY